MITRIDINDDTVRENRDNTIIVNINDGVVNIQQFESKNKFDQIDMTWNEAVKMAKLIIWIENNEA